MLDTLMALWNQGTRGRGIMVATAFFIICISISLLLVSVQNSWTSWLSSQGNFPGDQSSSFSSADLTATARSNAFVPTAGSTPTISIYAPTATSSAQATPTPRKNAGTTSIAHPTFIIPVSTTPKRQGTPLRPRPGATATHSVTPTPTDTPTDTPPPCPTASATASPVVTPTQSPAISPTSEETPTPSVTRERVVTPTIVSPVNHSQGGKYIHAASSVRAPSKGQHANSWYTDCLHFKAADGIDMYSNAQVMATLEHNLGFILGGSTLGTLFFYGIVYLLVRKKKL